MDYKNTLNFPETKFEMKANLNQKEADIQTLWLKNNIYQKILKKNHLNKKKTLHDGPPYANGNLHVGHALNKILKDMVIRNWLLNGYYSFYIPGWDTHGLPIEHAVSKQISNFSELSTSEKRQKCLSYAKEQIANQKQQFQKFGLVTDFKTCYYTFENYYEINQLNIFKTMVQKNLIYQDFKPIYWSWSSKSALADAEVEYKDVKTPSIYVSFDVVDSKNKSLPLKTKLLIWTTTPWTIPSNQAICVNANFTYVLVKINNLNFVVSKECLVRVVENLKWTNYEIVKEIKGKELSGINYAHPMYKDRKGVVLLGDHVTNQDGSGLVHSAPGFGLDDYYICKQAGIKKLLVPIDDAGCFTNELNDPLLVNKFYLDANKIIGELLEKSGHMHCLKFIVHSEAHDWRTKQPVIYRATKQWFINLKKINKNLKDSINSVHYQSNFYKQWMHNMVSTRSEWCISRQRVWGMPIPIIFDDKNNPIMDLDLIQNIIDLIGKHGTNIWFEKPAEFFLTQKYLKTKKKYHKEKDIMDVWFDSGSSFNVLDHYNLGLQADIYLEGNDQYRGWFNSSIICSTIKNNLSPYKELLSHGFTLDESGHKMSKSLGNVIDPLEICNKYGADILRLWVSSVNYSEDHRIGEKILSQVIEQYRKIRNTLFRFILANLNDFDYQDFLSYKYSLADYIIINEVNNNLRLIDKAFEKYDYLNVLKLVIKQLNDLSSWYFELIKDSLYCDKDNHTKRRAIQSVLNYIFLNYLTRLSVILPHTAEEAYSFYGASNKAESIFLVDLPVIYSVKSKVDLTEIFSQFLKIKDFVYVQTEVLRNQKIINKNNEVSVVLPRSYKKIKSYLFNNLKQWLNVAEIKIADIDNAIFKKTNFKRCERCWTHYEDKEFFDSNLCKRCNQSLNS